MPYEWDREEEREKERQTERKRKGKVEVYYTLCRKGRR